MSGYISRAEPNRREGQWYPQKCDAKQPCKACLKREMGDVCTYEGSCPSVNVPRRLPRSPPREIFLDLPVPDSSASGPSYFLLPDLCERPLTPPRQLEWRPSSDALVANIPPEVTEYPPGPTVPSFTILPSVHFQTIPRPLPLPLSVIPPERVQVSSVALNDQDMTLCVFNSDPRSVHGARGTQGILFDSRLKGLCELHRLGLYFTQEKQEAILRGDTSNSVVHSNFVDGALVMGMYFCAPEETPAMVRLQARYVQRAWESLIHLSQTNQERDKAQALVRVAHSSIILGLNAPAQLYFLKAYKIIEKAKLRFLPEYGLPPEFSDQVREEVSVLSQAIYLENFLYLALGGPAPIKTVGLEREFRFDLQVRTVFFFVVGPEIDSLIWSSECTRASSRYVR